MPNETMEKVLTGYVGAYWDAVKGGYTGTYAQWCVEMAHTGENAHAAQTAAQEALEAELAAEGARDAAAASQTAAGASQDAAAGSAAFPLASFPPFDRFTPHKSRSWP